MLFRFRLDVVFLVWFRQTTIDTELLHFDPVYLELGQPTYASHISGLCITIYKTFCSLFSLQAFKFFIFSVSSTF